MSLVSNTVTNDDCLISNGSLSLVFVLLQGMPYCHTFSDWPRAHQATGYFRILICGPKSIYLFIWMIDWLFTWCFCGLNPWHWRTDLSRIIAGECLNLAETWWAKYSNVRETRSASFIFQLSSIQASMLLQVNYLDSLKNIYVFRL